MVKKYNELYEDLLVKGQKISGKPDIFNLGLYDYYIYKGIEYIVLADNSVILKAEWDSKK